jgi:hypothetical protein
MNIVKDSTTMIRHNKSTSQRTEPRFDLESLYGVTFASDCRCFVRNKNMRKTCFEMHFSEISANGLRIKDKSKRFLEFKIGSELDLTLDIHAKIFDRPIHVRYIVVHFQVNRNGEREYGLKVKDFDGFYSAVYYESFEKRFNLKQDEIVVKIQRDK